MILTSLADLLEEFAGSLAHATDAPDKYPMPDLINYDNNMAKLKSLWGAIYPRIRRDTRKAKFIDEKMEEMFSAFESGDNEKGLNAVLAMYTCNVKNLR